MDLDGAVCYLIGCGGWGCVYEYVLRGSTSVALKVVKEFREVIEGGSLAEVPTLDESLVERVRAVAEVIKSLKHPNLLTPIAYSERLPLIIYEFTDGGNLRGDLMAVIKLGIQVGDALRYLHSRGLVHRDVKPESVLICGGVAKVGDYSSLKKLLTTVSGTKPSTTCTPGYCAPEQVFSDLAMKAGELGMENRVDVYQLGNLLLEALTGDFTLDSVDPVDSTFLL